jgi:alkylhydroperoxidase family enzyme
VALGAGVTRAVLDDWRTAPVDERLRATLGFLQRLTLHPEEVGPADIETLHRAGVDDDAIRDAAYVCAIFNVIDRLSDALDFSVPPPRMLAIGARFLLHVGYR